MPTTGRPGISPNLRGIISTPAELRQCPAVPCRIPTMKPPVAVFHALSSKNTKNKDTESIITTILLFQPSLELLLLSSEASSRPC